MASIIAGHGQDGSGNGITGVAPQAKVLSIRVIPDKGDPGYRAYDAEKEARIQQSLATGIIDAARDGAKVISMSIGYSAPSSMVRAALQYAESRGVVLVASSGNSGQDDQVRSNGLAPVSFPAEYPGVLSVAAVNEAGAVAAFSSDNLSVQVAAPGVNVITEGRDGAYWLVSGTSPACALVAGVAALIKSKYPGLSPELVDDALTSTAGGTGYNPKAGFGTVNAVAALRAAAQLAVGKPGTSPETSSGMFGGGPSAVPASPVAPRGAGQGILYGLLGLVALGLVIYGWRRLASVRAEPAVVPVGHLAHSGGQAANGYPAPSGYDRSRMSYPEPSGYPDRPGFAPSRYQDSPGQYQGPPRQYQETGYYAAPVADPGAGQSPGRGHPVTPQHPWGERQSPDARQHRDPPPYPDRYPARPSQAPWPDGPPQ
jgi:subtilisin family serine protease